MTESADTFATASSLQSRGRAGEAERLYRRLVQETHASDPDYDEWMRGLAETYRGLGRQREAGYVLTYLQRFADAHKAFLVEGARADAARARELWARGAPEAEQPALHALAAEEYVQAQLPVHAAIEYALAGRSQEARREWERVLRDPRLSGKAYEHALGCFNLGLAARKAGDSAAARQLSRAQQLLEEVADEFESRGERERAFDCYAILLQLGREEKSFENLAEGYTNCIRICKEDNLKFYVLQYYEDFLRLALEREELHAAAAVAREAADYARRLGLPYDRGYLKRSAETWWQAAEKNERDGGPVELTENAYLAAVDGFASLGDFYRVRESYERLAKLQGLSEARRERYSRVASRYAGVAQADVEAAPFPDYLRQQHAYPPIWEWDMEEWELDGEYAAVCATIVGDRAHASMIRRRALQVLLAHMDAVRLGGAALSDPARLAQIAQGLGELQAYVALRPLETLFEHGHPSVRRGVMRACRNLFFKRTFQLIGRGLRDPEREVQDAALEAVESVHFPHAFDPLARIFRDHAESRVKVAALTSIGRIATLQAGEFLIEVLRYEEGPLRDVARRLLANFDNPEIFPIVKRYLEVESGPARSDLLGVLRGVPGR